MALSIWSNYRNSKQILSRHFLDTIWIVSENFGTIISDLKMKDFDFYHKTYIIYSYQKIDCSFMNKLKILQF